MLVVVFLWANAVIGGDYNIWFSKGSPSDCDVILRTAWASPGAETGSGPERRADVNHPSLPYCGIHQD